MLRNVWTYGVLSCLFLGIAACSKVPKGILPERKMQAVQTDMQIAEAMINFDSKAYTDSGYKEALYDAVFRKHNISQALYDSSLLWYGKNLDIYIKMQDRIKADLDQRVKALGDVQATASPSSKSDSVDIWPRWNRVEFYPNSLFNGVTFDIKPQPQYPSGSTFVLGMYVHGIRPEMKNKPEIRLSVIQGDSTLTVRDQITSDGYHETTLRSIPTRQIRHVFGYIRMDDPQKTDYYKIQLDSINLMRYNYRTDFSIQEGDSIQQPADTIQLTTIVPPAEIPAP